MLNSNLNLRGDLATRVIRAPGPGWQWKLKNTLRWPFLFGFMANKLAAGFTALTGIPTLCGHLSARKIQANGQVINYGTLSHRVVTTAFVNFVTDQLQTETSVFGDFKFHDSGVGTTAEANGDTGIETTDGESRATGTQTESAANAYRSVGTIAYTSTKAITEHGLFNDSSAGTLMDRSVFSAINVVNGDSIEFTYTLTINAGG
jgi:hypothetical protein